MLFDISFILTLIGIFWPYFKERTRFWSREILGDLWIHDFPYVRTYDRKIGKRVKKSMFFAHNFQVMLLMNP